MKASRFAALALFLLLAPGLQAQDDQPSGMTVSQWQCPQTEIGTIVAMYDSITRPIEDELVAEGMLVGAGMFLHQWGDEWNVNWYRLGQDLDAIMAAMAEVASRVQARHDNPPNLFASCTAHKDNIYFWGPRTAPMPSGGGQ